MSKERLPTIIWACTFITVSNIIALLLNWKYAQSNYKILQANSNKKFRYQPLVESDNHTHNTFMYRNFVLLCISVIVFTVFILELPNRHLQYLPFTSLQFPFSQFVVLFSFTIAAIVSHQDLNNASTTLISVAYIVISGIYTLSLIAANGKHHQGFDFVMRLLGIWVWQILLHFGIGYFIFQVNDWIQDSNKKFQLEKQDQSQQNSEKSQKIKNNRSKSFVFTVVCIIVPILICLLGYLATLLYFSSPFETILQQQSQISNSQMYQMNKLAKHQKSRTFSHKIMPAPNMFKSSCNSLVRQPQCLKTQLNHFHVQNTQPLYFKKPPSSIQTIYWLVLSCLAGILLLFLFNRIFHGLKQFHSHQLQRQIRQDEESPEIANLMQVQMQKQKNIKYLMVVFGFTIVCGRWCAQYIS